ncbi:MAG: HAD-IIB family hydrolase [Deltaproteobacteria bacterium]|jgi:sucrose-phosphate synthase|nr:HAD-IIB family hydrolase [Deltaproteobacteria bacterium]
MATHRDGFYLMLLSLHGLVRGHELELGRDADTGGQVTYVVELARALAKHEVVDKVDLVTRLVDDSRVDPDYAVPVEEIAPDARIVRISAGPRRYLAKERLWSHLDAFTDNLVRFLRSEGRAPDLVHGHYADAGYVAARLAGLLDVPMAFTGHSLGRVKRQRLLARGTKSAAIEKRYRIAQRIEAEETALDNAAFVVASTHQEIEEQYQLYDKYAPSRMLVIPPGVDLDRFSPPERGNWTDPPIQREVHRFLHDRDKPMILSLSRPDPRKNIPTLLRAYGRNDRLREAANLVLVIGTRDDLRLANRAVRKVMTEVLYLIDRYDLYGSISYPKRHLPDDVPDLYRLATRTGGVFVNSALTEPFGLTLLEAAASGLPIVATEDGGPRDILAACQNGLLVDPLDPAALGEALLGAIADTERWGKWSRSGLVGVHRHFSWTAHADRYLRAARLAINRTKKRRNVFSVKRRLIAADRLVMTDIDNTLIGDEKGLRELLDRLQDAGDRVAFGIATGRRTELTLEALRQWKIPMPTALITSVGSAIHYGPRLVEDGDWEQHINFRWNPTGLRSAMRKLPGLKLQPKEGQGDFKISYFIDPRKAPSDKEIRRHLRSLKLAAKIVRSHDAYLDLLPIRSSKGMALRYLALKWGFPPERILVAGDSGNDEEMLTGNVLGVVVGNHEPELAKLRDEPRIYFARAEYAWGILEGIDYYDFLGKIRVPEASIDD